MCWLDILLLTTYNATATFITKGGCCLKVGARLYKTRIKPVTNIAVVYLNLRKKRVKERSPQCRSFKKPCQVQRKYSSDK
jgi:hypothetical protein